MLTRIRPINVLVRCGLLALGSVLFAAGGLRAEEIALKKGTPVTGIPISFASGHATVKGLRFDPAGTGKLPGIVMLHGCDGWSQLAAYRFAAEGLTAKGHVVILIRYYDRTNTPDQITPAQRAEFARWLKGDAAKEKNHEARRSFDEWIATVRDAVAYARTLPNVDTDRVGIAGFSLGGYLALAAAPQCNPPVRAVVEMFGGVPEEKAKNLGRMPPTLIVHGQVDDIVSVTEAYKAAGLILAQKQRVEIQIHENVGHVCSIPGTTIPNMKELRRARERMADFFVEQFSLAGAEIARK